MSIITDGYGIVASQCVHFTWASAESGLSHGLLYHPGPAGEASDVGNVPWYIPISPSFPPGTPLVSITVRWGSGMWGPRSPLQYWPPDGDTSSIVQTDSAYSDSYYRSQNISSPSIPLHRLVGFWIDNIVSPTFVPLSSIIEIGEGMLSLGDSWTVLADDIPSGSNYLVLGRYGEYNWRSDAVQGTLLIYIDYEFDDESSESEGDPSSSSSSADTSSSSSSAGIAVNMSTPIINQSHNNLIPFSVTVEKGRESDSGDEAKIGFEIKASNSEYFDYEAVVNRDNSALTSTPSNDDPTVYVPEDIRSTYEHRNSFYVDIIAKDASGIKEVRTHVEPDKYEFEEPGNVFYIPRFTWE
jgi:hypothetical protein